MTFYIKHTRYFIRKFFVPSLLLLLGIVISFAACKDPDIDPIKESSVLQILSRMGGQDVIQDIKNMRYEVSGFTLEYEEEEPSQTNPIRVNDYESRVSTEILNRRLITEFSKFEVNYPIAFSSAGATITIDDQQGSISGQYSVPSYFFGLVNPAPLYASRIEANLKNYMMSNPIELIRAYLAENPNVKAKTKNNILEIPTFVDGTTIKLHIDLSTHLPQSATVEDADFLHGDVKLEVRYKDWQKFDEVWFPTKLEYTFNEEKVKEERIDKYEINLDFEEAAFTPETTPTPIPYDEALGLRGFYASQWYSRLADTGIPIDLPLAPAAVAADQWTQFGIVDQTIGENVKIIGRPDLLYWGVAINTAEGVYLVDAPLNQQWCRSIINAVKSPAGFPNSDIAGVIATHDHFDHFGGIREMAAEAGTVYVNADGRTDLQAVLKAEHTLIPDALSTSSGEVDIISVEGVTVLEEGKVEIHNVDMNDNDDNPHSDNMLLVYVPEYELLIQADLMNFGGLLAVYAGQGAFPMAEQTRETFKERAKFLLNYITDNQLNVSKIVGIHGGLGSIQQLAFVAQ